MSNNIISFIMINIYILVPIDIILVLWIFYLVIRYKLYARKYSNMYNIMKPIVIEYINNNYLGRSLKNNRKKFKYEIIMDIMLDYVKENNVNIYEKFEELGYVDYLINKDQKNITLKTIENLSFIKSPRAYNILRKGTKSNNFEIKYMSLYALSLIKLDNSKTERIINKMITSGIMRDRQIEIVNNFNLSIEECLELLEVQSTDMGRVILIRAIINSKEVIKEEHADRLVNYLSEQREVRIAAILALASSKNVKYLDVIIGVYTREPLWEVRAAIAKALINFQGEDIMIPLKTMVYDDQWWVRFNAVEVLARLGDKGVNILIDLSLDLNNEKVSNLAYYMLNSNKNVYHTIQNI